MAAYDSTLVQLSTLVGGMYHTARNCGADPRRGVPVLVLIGQQIQLPALTSQ